MVDDSYQLLNVRVIRITTRAAMVSEPHQAESHRRRASQLLDEARDRARSPRVLAEIDELRREVSDDAAEPRDDSEQA